MNNIIKSVLECEVIVLTGHTSPDGDALGSTLALYKALVNINKNPIVVFEDFSDKFKVIPGTDKIFKGDISELVPDVFITLDVASVDRISKDAIGLFNKAKKTINIDHHASNTQFADLNFVDENASSTSEIVFNFINEICKIDKDIASCLYAGIIYDTAGFRHTKTSANTHQIAITAHNLKVDFNTIYNSIQGGHTATEMKIFAKALSRVTVNIEKQIVHSYVTTDDIVNAQSSTKELGSIIAYLSNTNNVDVAVFAYPKSDTELKFSLRAKHTNVNKFCNKFGGGGHVLASGFSVNPNEYNSFEDCYKNIINQIKEVMKLDEYRV